MNSIKCACLLFFKRITESSSGCICKHSELLVKTFSQLQDMAQKAHSEDKIPVLDEIFFPYGIPMNANKKEVLCQLRNFKSDVRYDLSLQMNRIYVVYFKKIWIDRLCLISQFHLLDGQLYFSATDFLTRINCKQYEKFTKGLIGNKNYLSKHNGISPFYVRDKKFNMLRLFNPMGYPSVMYYTADKDIQSEVFCMLKRPISHVVVNKRIGYLVS